jgi:hypothetical protein
LIEHIIDSAPYKTGLEALAYHYCDFSDLRTLEPEKVLGSLVRQIALRMDSISTAIHSLYQKCAQKPPKLGMLVQVLNDTAAQTFKTTYLIIDGLDESLERQRLLSAILQLCKMFERRNSIKILLSSRPEYDIRKALSSNFSFPIEPRHTELAIETHIRSEVAKMPKLHAMPVSTQEKILFSLMERADGMFRWVQCQLDALQKVRTLLALEQALQTLPTGLYATYDRILSRIADNDQEYVLRTLHWLLGTERPLSLRELAEAVALHPKKDRLDPAERFMNPEDILELCSSLVRVHDDNIVVLSHFSVKEYLVSGYLAEKGPRLAKFALNIDHSWRYVSRCILSYTLSLGIRAQELKRERFDRDEFPLFLFIRSVGLSRFRDFIAMNTWVGQHLVANRSADWLLLLDYVRASALHPANCDAVITVQRILQCSLMCFWNGNVQDGEAAKDSTMTSAVEKVASLFLRLQHEWERPENSEGALRLSGHSYATVSPLCAAASFGYDHVLQALIKNGAMVDGISSMRFAGNPLLRALQYGHIGIARILLDFGANINIRGLSKSNGCTALTSAALHSTALVEYLLDECKVNTNMVDAFGRTFVSNILPDLSYPAHMTRSIIGFCMILRSYEMRSHYWRAWKTCANARQTS